MFDLNMAGVRLGTGMVKGQYEGEKSSVKKFRATILPNPAIILSFKRIYLFETEFLNS